jgi:hypothetical protein
MDLNHRKCDYINCEGYGLPIIIIIISSSSSSSSKTAVSEP